MAGLILEGVTRHFGDESTPAVNDLSLDVRDGELLVIVGPSGCGKTTTLRMIAGLEEMTRGTIRIGESVVNDSPPKDRDIAMVFQNYALYPHLSVRRNLSFGLELRRPTGWWRRAFWRVVRPTVADEIDAWRQEIDERIAAAAELLGIAGLLDRMPGQLSGGERQRVAVGRAIVRQPSVFLFDEPLSNLDARLRIQMRRELKQLHARLKTTMIYVTHDQVEALTLGERIAVMRDGQLQQTAPPMEVYHRPANRFVASFLGAPPMNFFPGRLEADGGGAKFCAPNWSVQLDRGAIQELQPYAGRKLILGIRPEHVSLGGEGGIGATVTVVEPLGDATIVQLELGEGDGLVCKTGGGPIPAIGARVKCKVDPLRTYLFDPHTEANLYIGRAADGDSTQLA